MTRRQFAFWIGFGLFGLSEKLRADGLDRLAAATMRAAGPAKKAAAGRSQSAIPVHWTAQDDTVWRWYERETLIKGKWVLTGRTTPINKKTGQRKWEPGGYLDASLLPEEMRTAEQAIIANPAGDPSANQADDRPNRQLPEANRRNRHGRPPSKWLRSLHAYELRTWLKTIEVPEADVSGMSFWEHLTRDHLFDTDKIVGLDIKEQAKLHAAAHYGY